MALDRKTRAVLDNAQAEKTPVYLSGSALDMTFESRIIRCEDTLVLLENGILSPYIRAFLASSSFSLQCSMIRFISERIESDGVHVVFPISAKTLIDETRQSERFPFAAEERVVCDLLNPFDGETRLKKAVMDMSAEGLSLRTNYDSKLFDPGTVFTDMRVLIDGKPYTQTAGRVVYKRKLLDLKGKLKLQIGFQLEAPP